MLYGSYFGDWDNTNNLMRASLASEGGILTCCWAGAPVWDFHHMALGMPIGYSTLVTQNNINLYAPADRAYQVPTALLGDPTLRLHMVLPPGEVEAEQVNGSVHLSWQPSADEIEGYHVFRAATLFGEFTRITGEAVTTESFSDPEPLNGKNVYMVRALKLESSASGSYYNLSQGVIDSLEVVTHTDEPGEILQGHIRVYPNPTGHSCRVEVCLPGEEAVRAEIITASGMLIRRLENPIKTDTNRLIYFWDGKEIRG